MNLDERERVGPVIPHGIRVGHISEHWSEADPPTRPHGRGEGDLPRDLPPRRLVIERLGRRARSNT